MADRVDVVGWEDHFRRQNDWESEVRCASSMPGMGIRLGRYDINDLIGLKWQAQFSKDPEIAHQVLDVELTVRQQLRV